MTSLRRTCAKWLRATVAAVCVTCAAAHAADRDYSDLWWTASESGWGLQLVRGGDVMFATMFVYDASMRPTFFTATLSMSGPAWTGALFETSGPFFASASFDASKVTLRSVGALTFTPLAAESATIQYSVDGNNVSKNVTRQTLRFDNYSGTFPVTTQRVITHCPDASRNGERISQETIAIAHDGTVIAIDWPSSQASCRYTGAYLQNGKLGAAQTTYTCSDGEAGDFTVFEMTRHDGFISGRFQGHSVSNGCDYRGRIAGFVPD
jgi:hypothetical protein